MLRALGVGVVSMATSGGGGRSVRAGCDSAPYAGAMPVHEINVTVPAQSIRNADMEIVIDADGRRFGRVRISKGSIDWVPANSPVTRRVTWERFAQLMEDNGRKVRSSL